MNYAITIIRKSLGLLDFLFVEVWQPIQYHTTDNKGSFLCKSLDQGDQKKTTYYNWGSDWLAL